MDYENLTEITVKSQKELDMIPKDFKGNIYIKFGTHYNPAVVKNKYYCSVIARGNSFVEARENSSVVSRGNSSVEAWENSFVEARENSSVVAWENSSVEARENSSVVSRGNSFVEAWENSSVVAQGNTQIVDCLDKGKIKISGNARIVYNPKNVHDFMKFYGIKHTKKKAILYKAVKKSDDGVYHSDYDNDFTYTIGQKKCVAYIDTDVNNDCGVGIHISPLNWALKFGCGWNNLAIIEVETNIDDIICPLNTTGKVRTSAVTVIREVPLEECGLYGKILAKRKRGETNEHNT